MNVASPSLSSSLTIDGGFDDCRSFETFVPTAITNANLKSDEFDRVGSLVLMEDVGRYADSYIVDDVVKEPLKSKTKKSSSPSSISIASVKPSEDV